jgi:hypothetical protein
MSGHTTAGRLKAALPPPIGVQGGRTKRIDGREPIA